MKNTYDFNLLVESNINDRYYKVYDGNREVTCYYIRKYKNKSWYRELYGYKMDGQLKLTSRITVNPMYFINRR